MSVTIRPFDKGGWEYDISLTYPTGEKRRERRKAPVSSKSGATRWAEARERHLLLSGPPRRQKEVPTLEAFAPRFMDGHARANQQKPATIGQKQAVLRTHLVPLLGGKRLDRI